MGGILHKSISQMNFDQQVGGAYQIPKSTMRGVVVPLFIVYDGGGGDRHHYKKGHEEGGGDSHHRKMKISIEKVVTVTTTKI